MLGEWRAYRRLVRSAAAAPRGALLMIPLALAFCGVSTLMLLQLRHRAYDSAMTSAGNLLAAVSQDIARTVESYDLSLQAVQEGVGNPEVTALPGPIRQLVLFDRAATAPYLGNILVTDEHGVVTIDSASVRPRTANLAGQSYFAQLRDHPQAGLIITVPSCHPTAEAGADCVLALTRRISRRDGSFAGVVTGTLKLDYLHDLFTRFRLGPQSGVTLFLADGTLVAHAPWHEGQVGRTIAGSPVFTRMAAAPAGVLAATSAVDGVSRIFSYTRVGSLPLILDVALSPHDVYATWFGQGLVVGGTLLLLCLASILLSVLLSRELRRRSQAEQAIRESEAQYRMLAGNATDVIIRMDETLQRSYVSPASLQVLGYAPDELLDGRVGDRVHPDDHADLLDTIVAAQAQQRPLEVTYRLRHRDGHYVWVEAHYSFVAEDGGFIVVLRDVTKRKLAEAELAQVHAELARLATSDALTGLANRRLFDERLEQEWRRAARDVTPLSLLMLDVDHFKRFNDRYGHPDGDVCLRRVADVVASTIHRPGDLAARYGGEELVVVLPSTDRAGATLIAERLRAAIEELGIAHEGNPEGGGVVTVSIGCATTVPIGHGWTNGGPLVSQADAALYQAKRAGRNLVVPSGTTSLSPTPPQPPQEAQRLCTLARYEEAGAAGPSPELDEITRLAAELFETPNAYVNLIGAEQQVFVSAAGAVPPSMPREDSFCAHTITHDGVLVVGDTKEDPRFRDNPMVTPPEGLRFYAGAPLVSPLDGQPLGALCVIDTKPRDGFNAAQMGLLTKLASLAAASMERRRQHAQEHAPA